jgi:hypothetical protein
MGCRSRPGSRAGQGVGRLEITGRQVPKVTRDYQAKVIQANRADPGNGPGWFALHEALHKIDKGIVQDMRELGVKCTPMKGWAEKSDFDRTAGKVGPGDGAPADGSEYLKRGFASLKSKIESAQNDPVAFSKALNNGLGTCLPHSRDLVKRLGQYTGALRTTTQDFKRHVSAGRRDCIFAGTDFGRRSPRRLCRFGDATRPAETL